MHNDRVISLTNATMSLHHSFVIVLCKHNFARIFLFDLVVHICNHSAIMFLGIIAPTSYYLGSNLQIFSFETAPGYNCADDE